MMRGRDFVFIEVASKNYPLTTRRQLEEAAMVVVYTCVRQPFAKLELWVEGYDDDPREVWDIPEVREQVNAIFTLVFAARPHWTIADLNLEESSYALLGMCCGLLEITGRNPENGNYLFAVKAAPPDPPA